MVRSERFSFPTTGSGISNARQRTMPHLSEREVMEKLRERGVADHVIQGGAARLVAEWQRFVSQVEQGYPLGLDDYRNDLDLRELIAWVGLEPEVAAEDERLRNALTDSGQEIWEGE